MSEELRAECARLEASRAAFARSADEWRERAMNAEADLARVRAELALLRELADDLNRWREAGGDVRDLAYVLETMKKYQAMKGGAG